MEDEIKIVRIIVLGIVGFVACVAGCTANTNYQIRQEISSGADPLAVACAHAQDNSSVSCALIAAKR